MLTSLALAFALRQTTHTESGFVSFTAPAETIEKALIDLSKETGLELSVAPALAKEIVILRFDHVPTSVALEKIGAASAGAWEKKGERYLLVRDVAALHAIQEAKRETYRAELNLLLPEVNRALHASKPITEERAFAEIEEQKKAGTQSDRQSDGYGEELTRFRSSLENDPDDRLLVKIVEGIGVDRLAKLCAKGDELILATYPTRLEETLSIDPSIWGPFLTEHNAHVRAYHRAYPQIDSFGGFSRMPIRGSTSLLTEAPTKVILKVFPNLSYGPSLLVDGSFYDRSGEMILMAYTDIIRLNPPPPEKEEPPGPESKEPELPLSDEAQEMSKLIVDMGYDSGVAVRPPPNLLAKLLRPDANEPLSLLASEAIIEAAKVKGKNVAVCIPDMAYGSIACGGGDPITAHSVIDDLDGYWTKLTEDATWIVARPSDPEACEAGRANRAALTRLFRAGAANGRLSIEDYAAYAAASTSDETDCRETFLRVAFKEAITQSSNDWWLLKVYGSLSTKQLTRLRSAGRVFFRDLSGEQTLWVTRCLLGGRTMGMSWMAVPDGTPEEEQPPDLLRQPTENLANGLDPNGWLELKSTSTNAVDFEQTTTDGTSTEQMTMEGLAQRLYFQVHPEFGDGQPPPRGMFAPHTDLSVAFTFRIAPNLETTQTLTDSVPAGPKVDHDVMLPAAFRKEIAEFFKLLDEQVKNGELVPPDRSDEGVKKTPPPRLAGCRARRP